MTQLTITKSDSTVVYFDSQVQKNISTKLKWNVKTREFLKKVNIYNLKNMEFLKDSKSILSLKDKVSFDDTSNDISNLSNEELEQLISFSALNIKSEEMEIDLIDAMIELFEIEDCELSPSNLKDLLQMVLKDPANSFRPASEN